MVKAITTLRSPIPLSIVPPSVRFHQTFNPRYVRLRSLHVPFKPTFFASKEAWSGVCGLSLSRKTTTACVSGQGTSLNFPSLVTTASRFILVGKLANALASLLIFFSRKVVSFVLTQTVETNVDQRFGHI